MRIGITCYSSYGGSGVVATELGKNLSKNGHEVHFITSSVPFRLHSFEGQIYFHEVKVVTYPLFEHQPYALNLAAKMSEVIKYNKLDILHVHYAIPHAISAYLAKQLTGGGVKIITTLHGTDITVVGSDPAFLPVTEFGIEQSDGVTSVSKALYKSTMKEFKITKPIEVIHNFIDTDEFSRRPNPELKKRIAPNGEKILVHISNFRPVKRVDEIVRLFARIQKELPSKLMLIGDGPERGKAEQSCRDLGICDHTVFLGKQNAIPDYLSIADLLVCASENESFGMTILEAMSCGVPVVAYKIGGIPEIIRDGKQGYMVPNDDADSFVESCVSILSDDDLHDRMAISGVKRAGNAFSTETIIPKYEAFYRKIIES
ncbi:MAG: N-acetyl-alpha-D-glucosaminyl L-malate synthase BshA [bacterium]|nr:N-acetyl-alpha-D-glucosaminyl L-malate synthase BshA [bacterium]